MPSLHVERLERLERVILGHVDGLGDRGADRGLDRGLHRHVVARGDLERVDEGGRQLGRVAAFCAPEPPGVVLDLVFAHRAVGLPFLAGVAPRECGLDAVGCVVGEGEADRAGGRDRKEVTVTQAVFADLVADVFGQAGGHARGEELVRVEEREGALFAGDAGRGAVGGVAHVAGEGGGEVAGLGTVVAHAQQDQRVAEPGEAEADAALVGGLLGLLWQGPDRGGEHVVEHPHGGRDGVGEGRVVETRVLGEGVADEFCEVDAAETAAAVIGDRDLAAGIGRLDLLAVMQVVVGVDAVEEEHAGLGGLKGVAHDDAPELAGADGGVDPEAVVALMRAVGDLGGAGAGLVDKLELAVGLDRFHERIGHADRDVEVVELAGLAFGRDEFHDVGVVAAQHAHLRAAPGAGGIRRWRRTGRRRACS